METQSLQHQLSLLSSISNFHWWRYITCDGSKSSKDICVGLTDHLLYHPCSESDEESFKLKYIPKSPRNRLMYYLFSDCHYPGALKKTVETLLKYDNEEENKRLSDVTGSEEFIQKPKKKRRYATRVLKLTAESLCNKLGIDLDDVNSSSESGSTLYGSFCQQLVTDGEIIWRQHNENQDTVIMSDYNPATGSLTPLSYVQVTSIWNQGETGIPLLKCTCHIYNSIQCAALKEVELADGENSVLHHSMTCMHCRFFKDYLKQYRYTLQDITTTTAVDSKVKSSLESINNPVVLLGKSAREFTTKLSVMSQESLSMIHITFNHSNSCFANCQNGECSARLQNKKKIPKSVSIQQNEGLCEHINTLFANFEVVQKLFPDYFRTDENTEESEEDPLYLPTSIINSSDVHIQDTSEGTDYFNISTGLWEFGGKSTHKPKEMNDKKLSKLVVFLNLFYL